MAPPSARTSSPHAGRTTGAGTRAERWKDPVFAAHGLAAGRMLGRSAVGPVWLHEGGAGAARHASIDAGHQYTQTATIPANQCWHVAIGVAGEGAGLEARLFDTATNEELDRSHGQTSAAVRACATAAARTVRLEAHATAGKLDAILGERLSPNAN